MAEKSEKLIRVRLTRLVRLKAFPGAPYFQNMGEGSEVTIEEHRFSKKSMLKLDAGVKDEPVIVDPNVAEQDANAAKAAKVMSPKQASGATKGKKAPPKKTASEPAVPEDGEDEPAAKPK